VAFDYIGLRDSAVAPAIVEFGDDGFFLLPGESVGEDYESRLDSDVECPLKCVRTKFTKAENNGTLVEKNDLMYLVSTAGVSFDPELVNRFVTDCTEYQIVRIDPLKPGPVVMLWKVHVRK